MRLDTAFLGRGEFAHRPINLRTVRAIERAAWRARWRDVGKVILCALAFLFAAIVIAVGS